MQRNRNLFKLQHATKIDSVLVAVDKFCFVMTEKSLANGSLLFLGNVVILKKKD